MVFNRSFEIDYTTVVIFVSAICALILQLWLCLKVKRILMKLIPIALLAVSTIVFGVLSAYVDGWDGLGYFFFAFLSFGLILVCGIGWIIWAIVRKRN